MVCEYGDGVYTKSGYHVLILLLMEYGLRVSAILNKTAYKAVS